MKAIVRRTEPASLFSELRTEIDRLFEDFFAPGFGLVRPTDEFVPRMEVQEKETEYVIRAELPGIDPNKVDLSLTDNVLTLRGEKPREKPEGKIGYEYTERSYGSFSRSIQLPSDIDPNKVDASYKHGVLEIHVAKSEEARPHKIKIAAGEPTKELGGGEQRQ